MKQVEERYISFEASKMAYRDIKNCIDTAKQEGLAEGIELGRKICIIRNEPESPGYCQEHAC